jgi:hypothetical protein
MPDRIRTLVTRENLGWAALVVGAVLAVLGWIGVSGKDIAPLQLPYLASGSVGGIVLAIVGVGLLVTADLRRDRERLGRIEGELLELQDRIRELAAPRAASRRASR